jgi:FOG: CheY-like receiver
LDDLNNKEHASVLLIEDNHADIRMIKEIFKEFNTKAMINVVTNGVEALKFLNKEHENSTSPNLILLDLNIPLIDGFEVLKEIKGNNKLKNISLIILTTSHSKEDFLKAQELQVDCFINKPLCYDEYKIILQHIKECWLKINLFSK